MYFYTSHVKHLFHEKALGIWNQISSIFNNLGYLKKYYMDQIRE